MKTDLLRAYNAAATEDDEDAGDAGDATSSFSALSDRLKAANVEVLQKKIHQLEKDNRQLQEEATELAQEAQEVEEKEERLVSDAVKHLSEANVQISVLSEEFTVKSDESRKQKEEITHLLAQVGGISILCISLGLQFQILPSTQQLAKLHPEEIRSIRNNITSKEIYNHLFTLQ